MPDIYSEILEVLPSSLQPPAKLTLIRKPGSKNTSGGTQPQSSPKVVVLQVIQPPRVNRSPDSIADFIFAAAAVMSVIIVTSLCLVPTVIAAALVIRAVLAL